MQSSELSVYRLALEKPSQTAQVGFSENRDFSKPSRTEPKQQKSFFRTRLEIIRRHVAEVLL
jgi:hypothetical protein